MILVDRIREHRQRRQAERFLRDNTWEGLIPGDVVDYKGKGYLYKGMNPHGGPGMADEPDPYFLSAAPREAHTRFYIRPITESLPMPKAFMETAEPTLAGNTGSYIAFLNPKAGEIKKVGHITAQEWNRMIAEVQAELKGKVNLTFDPFDVF